MAPAYPTDAEVRAWAKETGREVTERGKVTAALRGEYAQAHGADTAPDYPDGMTDGDFVPDDEAGAELPPELPEARPSRPKGGGGKAGTASPSATTRAGSRLRSRLGGGSGKQKRKPERVPADDLIASAWRIGAKLAAPLPPLHRVLRLQSVIAGPLMDRAVQGTMADAVLQPLARLGQAGETATALLAPPLAIGALYYHAAQTGGQPSPVVVQACEELLRRGLTAMMRVGGEAFAQQLARERDDQERYGASVDIIMAYILAEPGDETAEAEGAARAAAWMAGQPQPEPEPQGAM